MKKILIIGGGIGGLTTAIALRQKGFAATVYESAPGIKPLGAGIVLAANAMRVLRILGLEADIFTYGKALTSFSILSKSGNVLTRTDSGRVSQQYGTDNFTIHRADLHNVLLRQLGPEGIHLGKSCVAVTQDKQGVRVQFKDGTEAEGDYLIAADGIHSVIRRQFVPQSQPRYAGYTCWRAVTEGQPDGFDANQATETWGHRGRMGVVPLTNNRIYFFICKNAPAQSTDMHRLTTHDLRALFRDYHFPIPQLLDLVKDDQLIRHDILDIAPLRQFAFGRVVLMGDAAHATTPNMGQGACQAIEDALVVANCLEKYASGEMAFRIFEQKRLARTAKIIRTSRQIGQLAQLESPFLSTLRDIFLRSVPARINEKQLSFLYQTEFSV